MPQSCKMLTLGQDWLRNLVDIGKAMFFQLSCVDVRVGTYKRLSTEEIMFSNCGAGENSRESLGQQGDQTGQS